jgi:hypothetical protein
MARKTNPVVKAKNALHLEGIASIFLCFDKPRHPAPAPAAIPLFIDKILGVAPLWH